MALTTDFTVQLKALQTASNTFGRSQDERLMAKTLELASGTAASQADLMYISERTVASDTDDDIDLAGSLADTFGTTITMAEVVAIMVVNGPKSGVANTTDLTIGGATSAFEGFISADGTIGPIKPGGVFFVAAGDAAGIGAVTASTADILRVTNSSGASNTYQIGIIGRSA